jgi:hypothetical protein
VFTVWRLVFAGFAIAQALRTLRVPARGAFFEDETMDSKHDANNPDRGLDGLVGAALLGVVALVLTAAGLCKIFATCRFFLI